MRANLMPEIALAERLFAALRDASRDGEGVTRDAYGPGEQRAHAIVREAAEAAGLEIAVDHAGNMLMTVPGTTRGAGRIVLGSHLDSVRQGGNYDGAAGVLAGLAVAASLRAAGITPARDVTVAALRAEESGAWFPTGFPGSRMALGTLPEGALDVRRADTGRTLAEHMRECGLDPDAAREGAQSLRDTAAYLEMHIEQGPVLDGAEIPVGIVTGIPGSRRLRTARVFGETNHSGATPRAHRRDAALAAAELAVRLDAHWAALDAQGHQLVSTFCTLGTTPEADFGKVAGEAAFSLDVRSVDPASVDAIFAELHRLVPEIEQSRRVRFELGAESGSTATPLDPAIQDGLRAAADAIGVPHRTMPSGGGHDAAAFAQAGVPAGMIFVRNQNGSHNPHEAMRMEDFASVCAVMLRWTLEVAA
jgi:beta-ureidopropionase / N-carbamoyl-L-amino-acid hydrolase